MGNSDFDPGKVLDCIFDIEVSEILAEMENEPRHCNVLSEQFDLTPQELNEKLSYLITHGFVSQSGQNNDCLLYTSPSPRDKRQSRMPSSA